MRALSVCNLKKKKEKNLHSLSRLLSNFYYGRRYSWSLYRRRTRSWPVLKVQINELIVPTIIACIIIEYIYIYVVYLPFTSNVVRFGWMVILYLVGCANVGNLTLFQGNTCNDSVRSTLFLNDWMKKNTRQRRDLSIYPFSAYPMIKFHERSTVPRSVIAVTMYIYIYVYVL